jgi:prepilin-type N-terminal cleavage/methylation domain-containing protein
LTNKKTNNKGVTLIELMIALAILAMIMTAVIMLMSNNTVVYQRTKADINVQTTAQETFATLQDAVMQANEIKIEGYINSVNDLGDPVKSNVILTKSVAEGSTGTSFSSLSPEAEVYPTKMEIKYSVKSKSEKDNYMCTATYYFLRYDSENDPRYEEGTPRCNIYVTKEYGGAPGRTDDVWIGDAPTKDTMDDEKYASRLLTSSLSEVFFKINAADQAIGMDLSFNDKRMTYHTEGVVGIRNSYVLKEKYVRPKTSGADS